MTGRKGGEYNNIATNFARCNLPQKDVAHNQKTHKFQTIATPCPSTSNYILSSLLLYDGLDSTKYIVWENDIDNLFGQCRMSERRKLLNVGHALVDHALTLWQHFYITKNIL